MKNLVRNATLVASCFVLVLLSSCSNVFDLFSHDSDAKSIVFNQSYAGTSIQSVNVSLVSESIDIVSHSQSEFKVVIECNTNDDDYYPIVTIMNNSLKIINQSNNLPIGENYNCSVTLYVPEDFYGLNAEKGWNIETVSGYIEAASLLGKKVLLASTSGFVSVDNVETETLSADTVSGSIIISGKADSFALSSTSGSVRLTLSEMFEDNSTVNTVSGSIEVNLPENDGFIHSFETMSGSVKNTFTGIATSSGTGSSLYKSAFVSLTTKTISGSVKVSKK